MSSNSTFVLGYSLKVHTNRGRSDEQPFHIFVGDSMKFTLRDVPIDNDVEFEITLLDRDHISIDTAIIIKESNLETTGMEPRIGSKGVRKVAKSDRG